MTTYYYQNPNEQKIEFEIFQELSGSDNYELYSIKSASGFNTTNLHFKKLKPALRNSAYQTKIEYMIQNKPHLNPSKNTKICWPLHCVFDTDQNFVGYITPKVADNSCDLGMLLNNDTSITGDWRLFVHNTQNSCNLRIKTCLNICQALIPIIESRKYTFNSFTPDNIKVTTEGDVFFVDCELALEPNTSLTTQPDLANSTNQDSPTAIPQLQVAYTPPEMLGINANYGIKAESIERFSLAVILYQLMFRIHPFLTHLADSANQSEELATAISNGLFVHGKGKAILQNIPVEHQGFDALHHKLKSLFQLAFDLDTKDRRPAPQLWLDNLSILITDNSHGLQPNSALIPATIAPIPTATQTGQPVGTTPPGSAPSSVGSDIDTNNQQPSYVTPTAAKKNNLQNAAIILIAVLAVGIIAYFAFINNITGDGSEPEPELEANTAEYSSNVITPASSSSSDSDTYDAYSDPVEPEVKSRYDDDYVDNELEEEPTPVPIREYKVTKQPLYVSTIRANLRQQPNLKSPVVAELKFNTKLFKTNAPIANDGERAWVNVATATGIKGWMSSRVLTDEYKPIVASECGIRSNEVQYVVSSLGANVRSSARKTEHNILGILQQGDMVCPYMYVNTNDSKIGRWMGFDLTNGETGWVAESILEPVYGGSGSYDSDSGYYYDDDADGYVWY